MRKIRHVILVSVVCMLLKGLSFGDIYVWVDENGVKHFSNDESVQANDNIAVHNEIECSEEDEKKWRKQKIESKQQDALRKKLKAIQEENEALRKKKCKEAEQYKLDVRKMYGLFAPEIYPEYRPGESGSRMEKRNAIIKRNEKNFEEWKRLSKEAHRRADDLIEKYCKKKTP